LRLADECRLFEGINPIDRLTRRDAQRLQVNSSP
jgi:hypothetical protein